MIMKKRICQSLFWHILFSFMLFESTFTEIHKQQEKTYNYKKISGSEIISLPDSRYYSD